MARPADFPNERTSATATIASGQSLSDAVDLGGCSPVGIVMPDSWSTANLTLQASADGTNYHNLYQDDGTEYTVSAAASRHIILNPAEFAGIRFLKLRSGTSSSAVNQAADRTITLVVRPV